MQSIVPVRKWLLTRRHCQGFVFVTGALAGFCAISQYNYLLFHTLVETFSAIVAFAVFMLFWNAQRFLKNGFFLFIGIACLFAGIFDLAHALTHHGMSILPAASENISIQLKTAGRWIAGLSFMLAPLFLPRRINSVATLVTLSAVLAVVSCLIFGGVLPDFYTPQTGMTSFEKISRGLSCTAFLAAVGLLAAKRRDLDADVFRLLVASLVMGSLSEFASCISSSSHGDLKVFAHLSELVSLYLIYKAFIEVGLTKPYDLVVRSLKQGEEESQRQHQFLEAVLDNIQAGIAACDADGTLTLFNRASREFHGMPLALRVAVFVVYSRLACFDAPFVALRAGAGS
jgi:PAS domain-containing protein